MKPLLEIVASRKEPVEKPVERRLLEALREERQLERRLIKARAKIGPLKREFQERHRIFGLSNERLMVALKNGDFTL